MTAPASSSPAADAPHTAADVAFPIRIGPPEAFATVRALFDAAQFHELIVARRLGGSEMFGFPRLRDGRKTLAGPPEDANAALIRLLLDAESMPAARVRALCGDAGVDALLALGVLVAEEADGVDALHTTVLLAPLRGLWLASDLRRSGGRRPDPTIDLRDFVFPPLSDLTREFVNIIPSRPGARALELCAGSGVGALLLARDGATEAWATDITGRSVHYTRFNAALNALPDVVAVESDVWAGLSGETFDLVCAHPPYVPALAHEFDFRDGGEDGARITRAIVQGLGAHLRPGGMCAITCAIGESADLPVEARIRQWLGDVSSEFDLVVLQRRDWEGLQMYRGVVPLEAAADFRDAERWLRLFAAQKIERFVHLSFELRRTAAGRPPLTERRAAPLVATAPAIDWQFAWGERVTRGGGHALLTAQRPRVVPGTTLKIQLVADDEGGWSTAGARAEVAWPAVGAVDLPPLGPTLLELCDGTRDAAAIYAALHDADLITEDVTREHVAQLLDLLLVAGALESPLCPVPRRPTPPAAGQAATTATSSVPTQSTRQ